MGPCLRESMRVEEILENINADHFTYLACVSSSKFCQILKRFEGRQTSYLLDVFLQRIKKNIRNELKFYENLQEIVNKQGYIVDRGLEQCDNMVPTLKMIDNTLNVIKDLYLNYAKTIVVPPFLINHIVRLEEIKHITDELHTYTNRTNDHVAKIYKQLSELNFININDIERYEILNLCKQNLIVPLLMILLHHYHILFVALKNGKSVLHYMARFGGVSNLFCLLYISNGYVDILDDELNTPIFMTVKYGRLHNLISFILMGSDLNHKNVYNMNILIYAVIYNQPEIVYLLLQLKIDANIQDNVKKYTPLMYSMIVKYSPQIICMLLDYGVDLSVRDVDGNNALHLAVINNMYDCVVLLSKYECYPNHTNESGETPLYIATSKNNTKMIKLLLTIGADPSIPNRNYVLPINISKSPECKLIFRDLLTDPATNKPKKFVQLRDITNRIEDKPIPLINDIDSLSPPNFVYIKKNIFPEYIRIRNEIGCCNCTGDCLLSDNCYCRDLNYQKNIWYEDKLLKKINEIKITDRPLIYECNEKCTCNLNCSTRVAQFGIRVSMKLIKTKNLGYSLAVDEDVPEGTYIVEYVGKICTNSEANSKENDDYLHDIDTAEEGDQFCVDSFQYGNVSRFINHNCNPNLESFRVLFDHHDLRLPHICYFAKRRIKKGEFLSMSYGETFWNKKSFGCLCDYKNCYYRKD